MSAYAQTDQQWGRHSHPSPPLSARSGPEPLGGYQHPSHFGLQSGDIPSGLTFAFPPNDRNGSVRLFRRGIAGLDSLRSQRQTRGLELEGEEERGKLLRAYAHENSCLIFGQDSPTTNP